jgi:hypothetical protein
LPEGNMVLVYTGEGRVPVGQEVEYRDKKRGDEEDREYGKDPYILGIPASGAGQKRINAKTVIAVETPTTIHCEDFL